MAGLRKVVWEARLAIRDARAFAASDREGREAIARGYFFRVAHRFTRTVMAESGAARFHVATGDLVVGRNVFTHGSFDREAMDRALAEGGVDVAGKTVLDVGANIGTSSVEFIRRFDAAHVVAVEADPSNFKLLRINVIENDLEDRITCLHRAISDRPGTLRLRRSQDNWGDHRVDPDGDVPVPAVTLDSLVEDGTIDLDELALLWMDVQGHEAHVLSGAQRMLAAGVPVITEFWPEGLGDRLPEMASMVAAHYGTVIDLGHPHDDVPPRRLAAADMASIASRYPGGRFADLVLLP